MQHKQNESLLVQESLNDLLSEADALFTVLDQYSAAICELEKKLNNSRLFFSFVFLINKEEESLPKEPELRHKEATSFDVIGYKTRVYWYLSWEANEASTKVYRLYLIAQEREVLYYNNGERFRDFSSTIIFRKPLIETTLATRLQYCKYVASFIVEFKKYLKDCRVAIESGNNPFEDINQPNGSAGQNFEL